MSKLLSRLKWLLLAAPPLWLLFLVNKYGVDVPFGDEWNGMCALYQKMYDGQLGIADFFAPHNEHRIIFPRLIMYAAAKLSGWNVRFELLIIWLLACVILAGIIALARATRPFTGNYLFYILLISSSLIFTPLEWENWLWGFQIGFVFPTAIFMMLLLATRLEHPLTRFAVSAALCMVNTLSIASGLIIWFLCAPLLLWSDNKPSAGKRFACWVPWLTAMSASLLLFFYHYPGQDHASLRALVHHPFQALEFFLALLGLPFFKAFPTHYIAIAMASGLALLTAFAAAAAFLWRHWKNSSIRAGMLPWIAVCLYAILNTFLVVVGRFEPHFPNEIASRYTGFTVMLPIGLLFIFAEICSGQNTGSSRPLFSSRDIFPIAATILAMAHFWGAVTGISVWNTIYRARLTGKSLLLTINQINEPALVQRYLLGHCHGPMQQWINTLNRIGYLRPTLPDSFDKCKVTGEPTHPGYGYIEEAGRLPDNQLALTGWAILPDKKRPADAVLLTYMGDDGNVIPFALAEVGSMLRDDVADKLSVPDYVQSGWEKTFDSSRLPPSGKVRISAWAFDALECKAYPLNGSWSPN